MDHLLKYSYFLTLLLKKWYDLCSLLRYWCLPHSTHIQVFDGHGGSDAALFIRSNILKFITEDSHFPDAVEKAIRNAFAKADYAFKDASSLDCSSGTTALVALILGRYIFYFFVYIEY